MGNLSCTHAGLCPGSTVDPRTGKERREIAGLAQKADHDNNPVGIFSDLSRGFTAV